MIRNSLVLAALWAIFSTAMADDWFTVEIIVFEHRDDATAGHERFPNQPGMPEYHEATALVPPTVPASVREFEQTNLGSLRMSDARRTLERSARYRPLLHAGWRQLGRTPADVIAVRIDLAMAEPLQPEILEPENIATDMNLGDDSAPDPLARLWQEYSHEPEPQQLIGTLRLSLQRFLHVDVDLLLTSSTPLSDNPDGDWELHRDLIFEELEAGLIGTGEAEVRLESLNATPRYESWRLQESRRVRSGEIHYLDHPRFGVIVLLNPVARDDIEARSNSSDRQ